MNGPQHFAEAERLLDGPINISDPDEYESLRADNLSAAQVHATLALAAATMNAADVVHYTNRASDSKHTAPMDLECTGAPNWAEVLA